MTCEIIKAATQVASRIPAHEAQPITVCSFLCFESLKRRKKTRRAETDAYRTPRKMSVGIMNEKATFLKTGSSDPNAGAVMYWPPT